MKTLTTAIILTLSILSVPALAATKAPKADKPAAPKIVKEEVSSIIVKPSRKPKLTVEPKKELETM
jgi:hypothetical protein